MTQRARLPDAYQPEPVHGANRMFIAVEGVSGSGKSTVTALLAKLLIAWDLHVLPPAFQKRSPLVNEHLRPLPQLVFYMAGLLHASDLVREKLPSGNVVTDRYAASVLANHAAVHGLPLEAVTARAGHLLGYLARPTLTAYLNVSPPALTARIATKTDITAADRTLFHNPGLLARVQANYASLAARDPRAVVIDTDDLDVSGVAQLILAAIGEHHGR